jgi:transcriptional regulator with XRE-family HTH domain
VKRAAPTRSRRLAQKLKRIRVRLGLSQNQILERLGFSEHLFRSNISQYERGARVPSAPVLLEYARLAKVSLEILVDDDLDLPERFQTITVSRTKSARKHPRPRSR